MDNELKFANSQESDPNAPYAGNELNSAGKIENEPPNNQWEANCAELKQLLEDTRAKAEANWNDLLRARAEVENVRRRAERDVEHAHKFGLERLVSELLPVKDSLEMGIIAATDADQIKLREGMELTLKMMSAALTKFGVREVNPHNERFNPDLHQAMTVQPNTTLPPNTVTAVYQKGYTLNDRLMRPALVVVSQSPEKGAA